MNRAKKHQRAMDRLDDAHLHDEIDPLDYERMRRRILRGEETPYHDRGLVARAIDGDVAAITKLAIIVAVVITILVVASCAADLALNAGQPTEVDD